MKTKLLIAVTFCIFCFNLKPAMVVRPLEDEDLIDEARRLSGAKREELLTGFQPQLDAEKEELYVAMLRTRGKFNAFAADIDRKSDGLPYGPGLPDGVCDEIPRFRGFLGGSGRHGKISVSLLDRLCGRIDALSSRIDDLKEDPVQKNNELIWLRSILATRDDYRDKFLDTIHDRTQRKNHCFRLIDGAQSMMSDATSSLDFLASCFAAEGFISDLGGLVSRTDREQFSGTQTNHEFLCGLIGESLECAELARSAADRGDCGELERLKAVAGENVEKSEVLLTRGARHRFGAVHELAKRSVLRWQGIVDEIAASCPDDVPDEAVEAEMAAEVVSPSE